MRNISEISSAVWDRLVRAGLTPRGLSIKESGDIVTVTVTTRSIVLVQAFAVQQLTAAQLPVESMIAYQLIAKWKEWAEQRGWIHVAPYLHLLNVHRKDRLPTRPL